MTSREDLRTSGVPGTIPSIGPVGPGAGIAGGKVRPVSRTYSAPLPLISGTGNPSFLQINPSAAGKSSSGSHSPREGTNQAVSGVMPYLGSVSAGLFPSSSNAQLQHMAHPSAESNMAGTNQDFHTIRQQLRANVLQKSKEKHEKKIMVRTSIS